MITSGEKMEEKRKNMEKELLEEELDLDQEELDKMNDEDTNQNSKKSIKSEESTESEESQKSTEYEGKARKRKDRNFVVFIGKVVNKFPDNMFHVSLPSHKHRRVVLCYLSLRMRKNRIPVFIGDMVKIRRKKKGFKNFIFLKIN